MKDALMYHRAAHTSTSLLKSSPNLLTTQDDMLHDASLSSRPVDDQHDCGSCVVIGIQGSGFSFNLDHIRSAHWGVRGHKQDSLFTSQSRKTLYGHFSRPWA